MTPATLIDRAQNCRVSRGQVARLVLSIRKPDGALADLTGRAFLWRIFDGTGEDATTPVGGVGIGTEVRLTLTGAATYALSRIGLRHQVAEVVEGGTIPHLEGSFAAGLAPALVSGIGDADEHVVIADEGRGTVIIEARGPPGLSAAEVAGVKFDAVDDETIRISFVGSDGVTRAGLFTVATVFDLPALEPGFAFLTDVTGAFLTDANGNYFVEHI